MEVGVTLPKKNGKLFARNPSKRRFRDLNFLFNSFF